MSTHDTALIPPPVKRQMRARFGTGPSGEEMLRKVPAVTAHGQHHMEGNDAVFEHAGDRVVLTKKWENKPSNHWVLNAYDIAGEKGRR